MKDYAELKTLIEKRGVHEQLGAIGEGWGIEQTPHELATFLVRMQELGVESVLEIGTGYKAGLARFLAQDMGWQVTTVDVQDYGHSFEGIEFITEDPIYWREYLDGKPIKNVRIWDLLFIDGAHDYASVKYDYEIYAPCATKAIAFHDIAGLRDCEGARNYWENLYTINQLTRHINDPLTHFEVIAYDDQRAGIGWIEL